MRVHKRPLVAALLASSALVAPAYAQTTETAPEQQIPIDQGVAEVGEIVVTGIRASQAQAINIKRNEAALVDAISAEDIGKLPDVTVADALQRVAGVQIQRSAGEGATVNIRGLPQVVTLLNGEQYLAPGNLGTAQPNLNDVPSQLMSSIVVFKSQDVSNALSGISGTIDLRTRRPMDFDYGPTVFAAAEYQTGERTRQDDYLFNGLLNWRGDRLGVMLSGVVSNSNLGNNYSGVTGGLNSNNSWSDPDTVTIPNWIAPHGYNTFSRVEERERHSLNGAFQFDIEDGIRLTGEVFYTYQKQYNRAAGLNVSNRWSGVTWTTPTEFEETGVSDPANDQPWLNVSEYDLDVWWLNSFTVNRVDENESTNFNLELDYDKGGPFTFNARAIKASASLESMNGQVQGDMSNWRYSPDRTFTLFRNGADRTRGPFYPSSIAALYPDSRFTNDVIGSQGGRYIDPNPFGYAGDPQVHIDVANGGSLVWSGFDNPIGGGLGNVPLSDYMANLDSYTVGAYSSEGNQRNESDLTVVRFDGSYEFQEGPAFGFITRVDAGVRHSAREVEIRNFHLFSDFYAGEGAGSPQGCSAQWKAIDVAMDQTQCTAGEFVTNPAFNPTLPIAGAPGQCTVETPNAPTCFQAYTVNRPTLLRENNNTYFLSDYGSITSGLPGVWVADPRDFDDIRAFQERVFGNAYEVIVPGTSYDVDLYEDSAYVNGVIGLGQLTGDIGVRMVRTELRVRQNQTGAVRAYGDTNQDIGDIISTRSYTDWLPTVNLAYDFNDKLRLRFAYAKTMIPLNLGNYGGGVTIATADSLGPTPDDPTAPPIGVRRVTSVNLAGDPELNPWRSDNFDLALEYYFGPATLLNIGLFRLNIDSFVTTATIPDSGEYADGDGIVRRLVDVTRPVQGAGGELQGLEIGAKLGLSDFIDTPVWSDFGFDGSYTYSDSSQNAQNLSGEDLPFPDNSEQSVNAAVWYQGDRLQARVAWNYRTPRLSDAFGAIPIYQDTAQYVDANITYEVNDLVTVYANGSNIFGEIEEYYVEFEPGQRQFHSRNQFEPRYSIGVRARF